MDKFFAQHIKHAEQKGGTEQSPADAVTTRREEAPKKLPKGVVLGKDGKP